ncbi:exodeoxyribonuclease V subunit beta [Psychromonas sp. CD1]|uniref:exodeoxyribonuclease V subunit beta n=1 Tax=Psychromonas sp. CD1 TaxID=1979839 RepID=UPI002150BC1D|nr:exodeoxyribonuclease V subunit beta [Psychromonas sp. CD1]
MVSILPQSLHPLTFPLYGMRLIEASAGTGKTYTIASLFIRLLLGHGGENSHHIPLSVDKILVVTFTEAATAELRARIRDRIISVRLDFMQGKSLDSFVQKLLESSFDIDEDIRLLRFAELQMDEAAVYTIHGFCQRMLMQNAFESGSLFQQNLLEDDSLLIEQACNDFWRTHFYDLSSHLTELIYSYWQHPEQLKKALLPSLSRLEMNFLPTLKNLDFKEKYQQSLQKINAIKVMWQANNDDYFDIISGSDVSKRSYSKKNLPTWLAQVSAWAMQPSKSLILPKNLQKFSQKQLDEKTPKGATPRHAVFHAIEELYAEDLSLENTILIMATYWVRAHLNKNKQTQSLLGFDDLLIRLDNALQNSVGHQLADKIRKTYPIAMIDEFQDTDPVQYRIFQSIYEDDAMSEEDMGQKTAGLFMIGDPKQAIYSFRGADIFTYMQARQQVSAHYSLDFNYRSSAQMIDAVNTFFAHCPAPFIYNNDIPFVPIQVPDIQREKLVIDNEEDISQSALQFIHSAGGENVDSFKKTITFACVNEIKNILLLGQQGKAYLEDEQGNKQAIKADDIAILVRTGKEASLIRGALLDENINSVYLSLKESVYATSLGNDLLFILRACLNPEDERQLRNALGCKLFALTPYQIYQQLSDASSWEEKIGQFFDYHALWEKRGVLVMLHKLFHEQGIIQHLFRLDQGERLLTDLLHLTELLQKNSVEHDGCFSLLRWFSEQVSQEKAQNSEQKQRLESEKDLVQVSTLHKSKGLQYNIVFMPFMGLYQKPRDCVYHDPDNKHHLYYDLNKEKAHVALTDKEQLAEDLRLLYVGLTRSIQRCYLGISNYKSGRLKNSPLVKSALGYICLQTEKDLLAGDSQALKVYLDKMCHASVNIAVRNTPPRKKLAYAPYKNNITQQPPPIFCRHIERNWWISSYSSLSRLHSQQTIPKEELSLIPAQDLALEESVLTPFNFPRGAKHGTFLHLLFELIDFQCKDKRQLETIIDVQLNLHIYDDAMLWTPILSTWFEQMLNHPLTEHVCLKQLSPAAIKIEMQFFLSMRTLYSAQIEQLIQRYDGLSAEAGSLNFKAVQGYLKGFIDLTFESAGKYYIVDYKSNYLGDSLNDYSESNIRIAMIEHRYDFQYQLYTLALHRLLRSRIKNYDYEQHMGGVFYLFIRGMQGDKNYGVYFTKPDFLLIDGLDKLFNGEN